ncbi:MAG: glycerophosphodiester phosphodiesterase [Candidatus Paceibacterota bacterium]
MARDGLFDVGAVIGHRGSGRGEVMHDGCRFTENTLASCLKAWENGASWVEVDVRFGASEAFLHHNRKLIDGFRVSDLDAYSARKHGVESLNALFKGLPPRLGVIVEVKGLISKRSMEILERAIGDEVRGSARDIVVYGFGKYRRDLIRDVWERSGKVFRFGVIKPPFFPALKAIKEAQSVGSDLLALHYSSLFSRSGNLRSGAGEALDIIKSSGVNLVSWCPGLSLRDSFMSLGVGGVCVDDVKGWKCGLLDK